MTKVLPSTNATLIISWFLLCVFCVCVESRFLNFVPGFEYQYKFNSNAKVKNVGQFDIVAKVGYTNIHDSEVGQEIVLHVYTLDLKQKHNEEATGHNWDLSKWFSFIITSRGEIVNVYHPISDDDEAVAIKKGLAAMFASRLHHHSESPAKLTEDGWQYTVQELGQEGEHEAFYTVRPSKHGHLFTKVRNANSHPVKHGESRYTKTLYYNNDLGNIESVEIQEHFRAMHKVQDGYDPYDNRKPLKAINNFTDIDFPEMSVLGNGKLEFLTRMRASHHSPRPLHNMTNASIHIKNVQSKKPTNINIQNEMDFIRSNLTCMKNEPEKGSKKMSKCFTNILRSLKVLPDRQIRLLAETYLTKKSSFPKDTRDRNHVFDTIAALNTEFSQTLLLDMLLNSTKPNTFLIQRWLIHLASMDLPPVDEVTKELEEICFQNKNVPKELTHGDTHQRILLTLGAIARLLSNSGRVEAANNITMKLQNLLGIHDPWLYRQKRYLMTEDEAIEHDHWRVVLLESLGNAALEQSYEYIVSHVNDTNSQWVKRAGIHALRKYNDLRTVRLMLKTALTDDDEKVRYDAMLQYEVHPLGSQLLPMSPQGIVNGSVFTDPSTSSLVEVEAHSRQKRTSFLDQDIVFHLKSPKVDWSKLLGSAKIGASFGIKMDNLLDFNIKPTEGYAKVYLFDEAYATVHLGVLGMNIDFFKARLCFKGDAEYNLNVLQEFDIDSVKKLAEKYDQIKTEVVEAIDTGVELFKDIISGDPSIGDMLDEFRSALEELPQKMVNVGAKSVKAMLEMGEIDESQLPPFIRPTRNLILKVTNLYNDIKGSVMTFYNTLMETVTVIIPRAGDSIYNAIKTIVDGFEDFNVDPKQALSGIAGNVVTIGMEVKNMVDAINKTKQACFFLKGQRPYWWDLKGQILEIKDMAVEAKASLTKGGPLWINDITKGKFDPIAEFTKGKTSMAKEKEKIVNNMKTIADELLEPLDGLKNLGGKFMETFEKVTSVVADIKEAFDELREGYRKARSLVDKVFGPKCHKMFPRVTRQPGGGCDGSGFFPSRLKNGKPEYSSDGVDVNAVEGSNMIAPFTGDVMLSDNQNEVIIVPTGGSLKKTEIIITNVKPNNTILHPKNPLYVRKQVKAGQIIGVVIKSECGMSNNHIHFAMRRSGGYIDPTQFLEARLPAMPKWVQTCDDYKVVWKANVVAAGSVIGKLGRKPKDTSPPRKGRTIVKPANVSPSKSPASKLYAEKDKPTSLYQKQKVHKTAVDNKVANTSDKGLKTLIKNPLAFLKKFSVRGLTLGAVIDLMDILGMEESQEKMADVIKIIKAMIDNKPCFNPHQMSDDQLRTELMERQKKTDGTREILIKRLTKPSSKCARMLVGMPENIHCTFDSMCLGLECCADFKLFMFRKTYKVYARFDPCDFQFVVGIEKKFEKRFGALDGLKDVAGGFDKTLRAGIELDILGGVELIIRVKLEKDDSVSLITLGVGFCSIEDIDNCIGFVNILDEVITPLPICRPDGTMEWPKVDYSALFDKEAIKKKLREKGTKLVKDGLKQGIATVLNLIPCISDTVAGASSPCPRPTSFTMDMLKTKLQERELPTTGTKLELIQRLTEDDKQCTILNKTVTLPSFKSQQLDKLVYLQISPNCMRVDACVDANISSIGFNKAFKVYIELDACKFTLTLNFETCTETKVIFSYPWGTPGEIRLSDDVIISYKLGKNDDRKVFLLSLGLKLSIGGDNPILDSTFIEDLEIPIPLCNEGFSLPGTGSIKDLAKQMGGKITGEVVDVIFKMLKLDTVFIDGQCNVPDSPEDCPWQLPDISKYLPTEFQDRVSCQLPENCFGVQCCIDFSFTFPVVDTPVDKSVPFFLKFDPCNFTIEVGFGNFHIKEKLLTYNWGNEIKKEIGDGKPAPVTISLTIDKYEKGFVVDLSVTTCIPIDDTSYCFPDDGLQLLQQAQIPACDAKALVEFTKQGFNLSDWAKQQGLDFTQSLAKSAAAMLLDRFGISPWLKEERCDVEREPYTPAVGGLRNDCPKSLGFLPEKLPEGLHCNLGSSCTRIECCFVVPFLDMSFHAMLDVDMCDYRIVAEIEKKSFSVNMLGDSINLNTGVSATVNISDVFTIDFGLKKRDKVLLLDLSVKVCFEESKCAVNFPVITGLEVPQFICDLDARANFKGFNLKEWAKAKGQEAGKAFTQAAVNLLLEQLGIQKYMEDPGCDRNSLRYQPATPDNWKNDCQHIGSSFTLPTLKLPANCFINDKCLGIDCCLQSELLGLSVHASFNIDLCNYVIEGNLELFSFRVVIFDYDWGSVKEISLDDIPVLKIRFKIDRILSQELFIVDLTVSVCFDGENCEMDLGVLNQTQLPMPGCAPLSGFTIPDFSLSSWLQEQGGEMTAQLSAALFKTLGIDKFLLDNQCQSFIEPFKEAVNGWKNDCPETLTLPALPDNLVCHIADFCTGISCCLAVPQIKRNFRAHLVVDSCQFFFSVGIEKIEFSYSLLDYEWGKVEEIDIGGVMKAEFSIEDLKGQKKFLINLSLKVCLTAGAPCQQTLPVFTDMLLPKPFCDWEGTKALADFSLTQFLSAQGASLSDRLAEAVVMKLLSFLKIDQFMLASPCNLDNRESDGWSSECPADLTLPELPSAVMCSIPSHCTGVECCIGIPFIGKNVQFKIDLDMCRMSLHLAFEKFEFTKLLFKYDWGQSDSFSLNGIFKANFVIDNLAAEKQFLVSLNLSACFDPSLPCQVSVPVVKDARFPNPVCDWEAMGSLRNFSLSSTLGDLGVDPSAITDVLRQQIVEAMGLSEFLMTPMCNRQTGIHQADNTGWNNTCPRTITLPSLPNSVSCFIPDYCTGVDCCLSVDAIGMAFNFKILLNACDYTLEIGIEKLTFKITLFQYKWGEWDDFSLNGVVKIGYNIYDLSGERRYLVSLKVSVCLEFGSPCLEIPLVTDARLPKPLCNWEDTLGGTSLNAFLSDIGATAGQQLVGVALSKFLNEIGLAEYLSDPQCSTTTAPYNGAVNGWKKDCPADVSLPVLPDGVVCHLADPCGSVECCVHVPIINRNFHFKIGLDPCAFTFTMGIEKLAFSRSLFSMNWGEIQHFNLKKIVSLDFMIDDLFGQKLFLINLNASVCFGEEPCLFDIRVLADVEIPKPLCDWDGTSALQDFSLSDTLSELQATGLSQLSSAVTSQILDRLKVGKYLQQPGCHHSQDPYKSAAANGWNRDCPMTSFSLPSLPAAVKCHLSDICTAIDCCVHSDFLSRGFHVILSVDMCTYQLTVGIENLVYRRMLFNYQWGQPDHFYMKGFIRIDYTIDKLDTERKLEITVSVSICWEEATCDFKQTVLDNVQIPIPLCDWKGIIKAQGFSFSDWSIGKGLSASVSAMTDTFISQLLDDMGVAQYLQDTPCDETSAPYTPANTKNWNKECDMFTLPRLPDTARCHIDSSCSVVDCCLQVPLVNRNIHAKFGIDVCGLQINMNIEKLTYSISLMEYTWGIESYIPLGSLGKLIYKIEHIPDEQKLIMDLRVTMCFGDDCRLDIPVLTAATLVYSPCGPGLSVPFSGVTLDFWKPTPCILPPAPSGCSLTVPVPLATVCQVTDNCLGLTCCVGATLRYLGSYKFSTSLELDQCQNELRLQVENKHFTRTLASLPDDVEVEESIGSAIKLNFKVDTTPASYVITNKMTVCLTVSDVTSCLDYQLLDTLTIPKLSTCSSSRKKRSLVDISSSKDPKELLNQLINEGASSEEIENFFNELAALEEVEDAANLPDAETESNGDATNTKTALKEMGTDNPATLLYSKSVGQGNLTDNMEGGEKIMSALGAAKSIAGRMEQTFIVGEGLTGAGVKLLGAKLAKMTIGQIMAMFDTKNIDPEQALDLTRKLRDLALALYSDVVDALVNGEASDMFKSFDLNLQGDFSFPRVNVMFFEHKQYFLVGGLIPMTFEWGAGASYGMKIVIGAKILAMSVDGTIQPYANAHVYGELGIGALLYGKLRIDGYIMTVSFPSTAEIGFSKFPLDLTLQMDLELTPIELVLSALVTLEVDIPLIGSIKKTLFKKELWRYATPTIKKRMVDVGKKEPDETPPQFVNYVDKTGNSRRRRSTGTSECSVLQLPGRDYTQPAFELAVDVGDDLSMVELTYSAGTAPGLSDLVDNEKLGGHSTVITQRLSASGVPIYFTVYGSNSAGTKSEVTCSIPTYDVTLPSGRLTSEFLSTSNPAVLIADVVVYEDSDVVETFVGAGVGKKFYSDQTVPYYPVNLKDRDVKSYDASSDPAGYKAEEHFTGLKEGRLPGPVIATHEGVTHAALCAKECMKYSGSKCLSFNFDYGPAGTCELLEAIEGHDFKIATSGQFAHFERLGVGLAHEFHHKDLAMLHQTMYYFNMHLVNSLEFSNVISSEGIIVDLTPPEPGPVSNVSVDTLEFMTCSDVIPDDRPDWEIRCKGINRNVKNHRTVHDGEGSRTVFNGDEPLVDLLYTRANRYVTANWDGVHDKETGILGYSWTVGREPCEELIHPHHDPHKHLFEETEWTHSGIIAPIPEPHDPLPDGKYYITLRALNKVEYGGPLATSICHTTPLGIDNTQPFVHEVFDVTYDEETFEIKCKYNATDPQSDIKEVDLCLGLTPRDCIHMAWERSEHSEEGINRTFEIPGGELAWVKIRAINHVDLKAVGVADHPIIIDITPPIAGTVYDGQFYKKDLQYTKDPSKYCSNWFGFFDPESGISHYDLEVHNRTGSNMSETLRVDHKTHETCITLEPGSLLEHGQVYSMSLTAYNAGHKQLNVTKNSDGMLVDLTPPVVGQVVDGMKDNFEDLEFSIHVASVSSQWTNYTDPESDIRQYSVQVTRARDMSSNFEVVKDWTDLDNDTSRVEWHTFHLHHRDVVKTTLRATNNALGSVDQTTDGFVVDLTPPNMRSLGDGSVPGKDAEYQFSTDTVECNFDFYDEESGIDHFKFQVYETYHGSKHQLYPATLGDWDEVDDRSATSITQSGLSLKVGALYSFRVGAINRAGSVTTLNTNGVILDNTNPKMQWVYVTIFSGSDEEVFDGYAIQSDPHGIKATWFATDPESGIESYSVTVGTTPGGADILGWRDVGSERDKYIDNLSLSVTNPATMQPVYYVTVKSTNGAGLVSDVKISHPIRVVEQDKPGVVVDGADDTELPNHIVIGHDVDYQADSGTVTVQFSGFESHEHGVSYFDWAVGTTPGGEEVQPFIMAGLIHEESETGVPGNGIASSGFGQAVLPLKSGVQYYTTVRGITNGGGVLQSTSDGFMVDLIPPTVAMESFADENDKGKLTPDTVFYQAEVDSIAASWKVTDAESPVKKTTYSLGTYPYGQDVHDETEIDVSLVGDGALPTGIKPSSEGKCNILTITVQNEVGLTTKIVSPCLVVDITPPTEGVLKCPTFIQPLSSIECTWDGFFELESKIVKFTFAVGSSEGLEDVIEPIELDGTINKHTVQGLTEKVSHGGKYYAKVTAHNVIGKTTTTLSNAIMVDTTPPTPGTVVELKSAYFVNVTDPIMTERVNRHRCDNNEDCLEIDATCQESLTTVLVAWEAFKDEETEVVKYEIAVGNTPGGGQLKAFFEVEDVNQRYMAITGLVLSGEKQIFVTVKATNGAGLSSVSTSNGVYISYLSQLLTPLGEVGVWDGTNIEGDIDFTTELSTIGARWDVSGDPCPVVKYEWAIHRADGLIVQDFIDKGVLTYGINDELALKNKQRIYQVLRVTNAIGFEYTLWSNGVTIEEEPLVPGQVFDGNVMGYDLRYHSASTKLTCNWDNFGSDRSGLTDSVVEATGTGSSDSPTNQEVAYYQVALGTDRRYPQTRTNVRPFFNVGLAKKYTFTDLDLVPETAIYYCTVRAYSTSGSRAEVVSNGASVGFDGGVTGGKINLPLFVSDRTSLKVSWGEFESTVGMMMYYVGLSDSTDAESYNCLSFTERGNATDEEKTNIFNVVKIENVGKDTFWKSDGLNLTQNGIYYLWVIGADKAGECNMVNHRFQVDSTPPVEGKIRTGPFYDMISNYAPSGSHLEVFWKGYSDEDSGLRCYHLTLLKRLSCAEGAEEVAVTDTVEIDFKYTSFKFSTKLERFVPYIVQLAAENKAGLRTLSTSPPALYDDSHPSPGLVIDGVDFVRDISWTGSKTTVQGTFLHHPVPDKSACPVRHIDFDSDGWDVYESDNNYDSSGRKLKVSYRADRVYANRGSLELKMVKDAHIMNSGAYYRDADLVNGGVYKISIKAASGDGVITSVQFVDGAPERMQDYDFTETPGFEEGNCDCCTEDPPSPTCQGCDCLNYFRSKRSADANSSVTLVKLTPERLQTLRRTGKLHREDLTNLKPDPVNACGLQILTGDNSNKIVSWCHFKNGLLAPKIQTRYLDIDPSASYHDFEVKFQLVRPEARKSEISWCYIVFIDGDMLTELCGVPQLSPDTKLLLSVWNHKNTIPAPVRDEDGLIRVWSTKASFKDLVMPPEKTKLCRYGDPFQGANNPVVRYEAAVGTEPGLADVKDYQGVFDPCVPCLKPCDRYLCNASCLSTETVQVTFELTGLDLNETSVIGDETISIIYYLTVKVLLASGAEATSSSDGFYVDSSPPALDTKVFYVDVEQGEFKPVEFQSSNNTIKAAWKCSDEESKIVEYKWAIGTSPGNDDVMNTTSTGENPGSVQTGLTLLHQQTYYVTLTCVNGAGLESMFEDTTGVTVLLEAPEVDDIPTNIEGADSLDAVTPPHSARTFDQTSIGCHWDVSPDPSVKRYDFCVGSCGDVLDDVFPCTWVGYNRSGTVFIKDGYLQIDDVKIHKLSSYQPGAVDPSGAADPGAFRMAPGSVLCISMQICNEADKCTPKRIGNVVIETPNSRLSTSTDGSRIRAAVGSSGGSERRKRAASGISIVTPDGLLPGQSIVVTELTRSDLTAEYRSDASPDFVPYISDPNTTLTDHVTLDRILRRRLNYSVDDVTFSITSVGDLELPGPLLVTFPYDPSDTEFVKMLLHWDPVVQRWFQSNSTCVGTDDTQVYDAVNSLITVKVCNTRTHNNSDVLASRRRRAVEPGTYFSSETQFIIRNVLIEIPNDPPVLTSTSSINITEDAGTLIYEMTAEDPDGDEVEFRQDMTPTTEGDLTITTGGLMIFTPNQDYHGSVAIPVVIYEVGVPEMPPATSTATVTINVALDNDPPVAFAFSGQNSLVPPDQTEPILILMEQNRLNETDVSFFTWVSGAYDVDDPENLTVYSSQPLNGTLNVTESLEKPTCENGSPVRCSNLSQTHNMSSVNWVYKNFEYVPESGFHGYDEVRVYTQDSAGVYSDVFILKMAVMERPCQNGGSCISKNETEYNCSNNRRADGFHTYFTCLCQPGYTGMHCEADVDECISSPCSWPHVCHDEVNKYSCACPQDLPNCGVWENWMIALIVLALVLLSIISILAWYIFMIKRGRLTWKSLLYRVPTSRRSIDGQSGQTELVNNEENSSPLGFTNLNFGKEVFGASTSGIAASRVNQSTWPLPEKMHTTSALKGKAKSIKRTFLGGNKRMEMTFDPSPSDLEADDDLRTITPIEAPEGLQV